jgi:capsid assembly protease
MIPFAHLAARAFNRPLAITDAAAQAVLGAFGPRLLGDGMQHHQPAPQAGRLGDPVREERDGWGQPVASLRRSGPVAVIEVEGVLVHKGRFTGQYCGNTSYEGLAAQIAMARDDASITAVVVEIDSPGGEVSGLFDCARALAALADAKPTVAILTDTACSAAYMLAVACRQIWLPSAGQAGSIGAITMHVDTSRALDNAGLVVTTLSAGAHKADGSPFAPLPPEVAARVRADLEAVRAGMCAFIGQRRPALGSEGALATEAQVYMGPAAVAAGLADAVVHPAEAFDAFCAACLAAAPATGPAA